MRVNILNVSGQHRVGGVDVELGDTVSELRRRVLAQLNLGESAPTIRFLFSGQLLQDDRTLESYNISDDATIHMISRAARPHAAHSSSSSPTATDEHDNQAAQQQQPYQQQQQPQQTATPHTIIGDGVNISHVLNMTTPLLQNALGSVLNAINNAANSNNNQSDTSGGAPATATTSLGTDAAGSAPREAAAPEVHRVHLHSTAPLYTTPSPQATVHGQHSGVPDVHVHVHCSMQELEQLPERLEQFRQRMRPAHVTLRHPPNQPAPAPSDAHPSGEVPPTVMMSVHTIELPHEMASAQAPPTHPQPTQPSSSSAASSSNHGVVDYVSRCSVQDFMGLLMFSEPVYRQLLQALRQEQAQHGQRDARLEQAMRDAVDAALDSPDARDELAAACRTDMRTVRDELHHWCHGVTQRLCDTGRETVQNEADGVRRLQSLRRVACMSLVARARRWFTGGLAQIFEILMRTPRGRDALPVLRHFHLSASQIAPMVPMILSMMSAGGAGEQPDDTLFAPAATEGRDRATEEGTGGGGGWATGGSSAEAPWHEACDAHIEYHNTSSLTRSSEENYDDLVDDLIGDLTNHNSTQIESDHTE